jgi:mono/diheme cytochrome c family protein
MRRDTGPFRLANSWPRIAWSSLAAVVGLSVVLGFVILGSYQPNGPTLGTWAAICRSLGITADTAPANEPQPSLRTPTFVAWTRATLDRIRAGDAEHGGFVALNCTACHGEGGVSTWGLVPTLAGTHPS